MTTLTRAINKSLKKYTNKDTGEITNYRPAIVGSYDVNKLSTTSDMEIEQEMTFPYWSPSNPKEPQEIFCYLLNIGMSWQQMSDKDVGREVLTIFFLTEEKLPNGKITWIKKQNASVMLTGKIQQFLNMGLLNLENKKAPGTALKIQYLGTKKNKTNNFRSSQFLISILKN